MHGNTRSHTVRCTCDWLWHYNLEFMVHPSYSHSLMPSDFHLFGLFKKHLAGKQIATDADVKQAVTRIEKLDNDLLYFRVQALVPR